MTQVMSLKKENYFVIFNIFLHSTFCCHFIVVMDVNSLHKEIDGMKRQLLTCLQVVDNICK